MKRFLLPIAIVVLLIVSLPSWLEAAPVDTAVAKQVAINFFHSKSSAQPSVTPTLVYVAREQVGTTKGDNPSLYIYNVGNGFVILSADDRVKPVLAYSTESNFDTANMPDALREWMDETRQQIKSVFLHGTTQGTRNQTLWRDLYENTSQQDRGIVRGPLLSTQWDQNAYYNNLCPVDATGPNGHTYAGCVATMMAQVLRYWQYPSAGFGSKFYNIMTYGTQYVNFANAHYNYSLMPNSLTAYSPSNQINEVAKLIYHCAVSVSMQFGPGASSAYIEHVNAALQNYFGYVGGTYHNRDNYSDASWIALLKSELNLLRPIMYSGRGSYGGHAFLCDGYDSDDLFHMNWGWGGFDNGFYNLNNLNTTIYDFNSDHTVLIGIHADTPMLMKDVDSFQFFTRSGTQSSAKEVNVHTHMVTDSIQVYAEGNFLVGRDSVNMSHSVKLNPEGQIFYVRYAPVLSDNPVTENGRILLSANANTLLDSIQLSGSSYVVHCPPPQALHLSQEGDVVNVQWDEPVAPVSSYHISKDSIPSTSKISFGNSGGLSMECVQRFMTSDIAAYHQKLLTKISFKPMEGADGYILRVYQGGSCTIGSSTSATLDPGTLVYSQEVDTAGLTMNGLSTVALDTAVIVDASQELWVGVIYKYLNGQNAFTPVAYPGMQIPGENDIIGYHYENSTTTNWRLISSFGLSLNNVMIVTLEDAPTAVEGYTVRRDDIQIAQTSTPGYQDIVTSPGQYIYQVITSWDNGCDVVSTGEINVEVPVTYMDTMVCPESMPLSWHGVTFNAADTQIVTLSTVHGADSILVLRVEVLNTEVSHIVATACGSYIWHAHTYTSSGDYTDTLVSAHGCDSIVTLHLTVNHATHGDTTAVACESFTWHGQTYIETPPTAPTYTITGGNAHGCDSIVTLHLTVNHATHGDTTAVACESFTWHSQTYTETPQVAPNYTILGGNHNGCDSVVTLHLTVNHATHGDTTAVACESFTWHGQTYTKTPQTAPTYTITGGNHNGCDSVVTLHLTINHATYGDTTAVACESFTWHGQTYTKTPQVAPTYTIAGGNAHGCDSIVTLHLTVNHATHGDTSAVACESFTWHGHTYTQTPQTAPTYTIAGGNAHGCDSVVTLHLTVNHATHGDTIAVACESFTWHGQTYTETPQTAPTYTIAGGNHNGCDSIVTLHLTVNHATHGDTTAVACESFTWHGQTYTETPPTPPTYTIAGGNAHGCDSIVTLHLTVNHATYGDTTAVACESFTWHGQTYTKTPQTAPIYTIAGGNHNGCDSIVTLHLTVNHATHGDTTAVVCESFTWHGQTYTETPQTPPTYTIPSGNHHGCDSIVTLHLTVNHATQGDTTAVACESFTWHGQTYTKTPQTAPTYTITGGNHNGCDSIVTLHLTVNHATQGDTTAVACESFTWHGQTYTKTPQTTPIYTIASGNHNGCDSIVTLYLTVNHATHGDTTAVACESFTWHGQTYTETPPTPPTYTIAGGNAHGCDSIVTLHLTVNHATHGDTTVVACESFTWHGQTYTQTPQTAPTYTILGGNHNGCDSIVTLYLTVNHATHGDTTAVVCESFTWHGQTYTETPQVAPNYTILGGNHNGCDSIVTLHLTVNHATHGDTTAVACESFTWHGQTYTETPPTLPTYTIAGGNAHGCDSIVTLHLTVNHATHGDTTAVACESFTWHGQTYTKTPQTAPTYTITGGNHNGCDSIVTLHLTVNHATQGDTTVVACESFTWHGQTYTETPQVAPTYTITGGNHNGCDSIVTLHLTVNHATQGDTAAVACESFTWHGQTYTETPQTPPTYAIPGGNHNGCDSIVTLHLAVNHATHGDTTAVACESFTWHGQTYTQTPQVAPTYTITGGNHNGCDSIVTLHLTVNHATHGDTIAMDCESFTWHGQTYYETPLANPTYTMVGGNQRGCDSIVTLYLTIANTKTTEFTARACEIFTWNNISYTTSGDYTQTFQSGSGCDSIVTLHLTVNHATHGDTTAVACESFTWHGQTYTESPQTAPTYTIAGGNAHGCDSIVTLHLTVNHATHGDTTAVACESFTWHGQTYTETPQVAPTYTITGGNAHGCDSIVTLHLTVNHATHGDTTAVACESFTWHGQTYTETPPTAPTYTILGGNHNGCDSIVTLHLTVNHATHGDTAAVACVSFTWHGQTYTETPQVAPNYTILGGNHNGCDSVVTLHLTVNHATHGDTTAVACESFTWHGHTYTQTPQTAPTYTITGGNAHGCDSIVTLHLTVNHATHGDTTAVACESFTWHGQTYIETPQVAPTYTIAGGNHSGCDSIVTLHLTVNHATHGDTTAVACESFTWHGQTYIETPQTPPTYTITGGNAHGCDSIVALHLTVNHATHGDTTAVACELFTWHGQTYTETPQIAPTYTITGGNHNGCDSIVTLHLTVNHATHGDTTAVACESFTWHGQTYTETPQIAPTYTIVGGNHSGCDSIVTLHLTVNHATHGDTAAVACESFTWHGQTFTETPQTAPTYTIAGGNAHGCDSVVTLHLTVNHATHGDTIAMDCESFTWHGQTYYETPLANPTYTMVGGNQRGCDSIVTLHLTIANTKTTEFTARACEIFTWNNISYTTSGDYTQTFQAGSGCDSIVTLHLTVNHATHGDTTAVACESFTWHGHTYNQTPQTAPIYTIAGGNHNGCDSIVTLHLTVNHATHGDTTAVACESFTWHGHTYNQTPQTAPIYTIAGGNHNGCDSIVTLHLTVNHATQGDTSAIACESFTWHGQTYTETPQIAPTYTIVGGNHNGCDSIVTLHLTVNHATHGDTTAVACELFTWHGHTYNETPQTAPTYTITGGNHNGCDSIVTLHLTVNHATHGDTTAVACESFTWHGQTYTETPPTAPTYTITCGNHNGCDSIVTLHLTVNHATHGDTTAVACESFTWHGHTYTETPPTPPTYTIAGGNAHGCDSVVTLHLTINHATHGDTAAVACESFTWYGQTYIETPQIAPTYTIAGGNHHGCDSIVTLHLTVNHATHGDTTAVACESFTWHGQTYTETPQTPPTYTITGGNAHGCDSIVTLHLTVNHATYGDTTAVACESFTWHGQTYTETPPTAPTYTIAGGNHNGCDSIVTLHLTVHSTVLTDLDEVVCESSLPYLWHTHSLTQSGDYTDTLVTVHGCDSIVTLHLLVLYTDTTFIKDSICENWLPISWNGAYFDSAGTQMVTLATYPNGCDEWILVMTLSLISITETYDTLYLTVSDLPYYVESLHAYITEVTPDTTYTYYRLDSHDCDSIIHLYVSIVDVGIENFEKQDLVIYPNPASETLHIRYRDIDRIQIFSITGQLVQTIHCEGEEMHTLSLSNMADGSYLICVRDKNGHLERKIINIIK